MEERTITVIPKNEVLNFDPLTGKSKKLRVCGYARVSTDLEDQKNSFEFQKEEFETRIKENPDWEFVGMYSDEGISGTNTSKRKQFNTMIKDAEAGKIDLILTKSLSRFARNTVDCLSNIRKLAAKGVSVYFEKENITTNKDNVDLILTIYASIAEAESRSISDNVKWGVRKRMQRGIKKIPVGKTIGYKNDNECAWYISNEAPLVENIFTWFLQGFSYLEISKKAQKYDDDNYQSGRKWSPTKIYRTLRNERYKGTIIFQKTVTIDVLSHKQIKNKGIEPQYVVDNHHEPIIDPKIFDYVQMVLDSKGSLETYKDTIKARQSPFARLLICEECGRTLRRIQYAFNQEYILTCKNRSKVDENFIECSSNVISVSTMETIAKEVIRALRQNNNDLCTPFIDSLLTDLKCEDFVDECKDLEMKYIQKQDELNSLLKNQMKEEEIGLFDARFSKLKEAMKIIKAKIAELKKMAEENHELMRNYSKIKDFLNDNDSENIYAIRQICSLAVHRKDGSIRFVLYNPKIKIDSFAEYKEKIAKAKPIYESSIFDGKTDIRFDAVIVED